MKQKTNYFLNPRAKRWMVLYSHSHELGFDSGLTLRQAQAKAAKLAADPQFLDYVKISYDATELISQAKPRARRRS